MALYPSLEDMKVDQMTRAEIQMETNLRQKTNGDMNNTGALSQMTTSIYPFLGNYMGLELTEETVTENMAEYIQNLAIYQQQNVPSTNMNMVAPISGQSKGLQRAQVTNGIREVILCKDQNNKVGLRVKEINKGIFISLVVNNSPAALVGLRFGDQILQLNGTNVAGFTMDQIHKMFKNCPVNGIKVAVRDRPFERTITLHKDSTGSLGFQFKNGNIRAIVKDSSAARNGVLIEHQLLEVNGQNVIGLEDKVIRKMIDSAENVVTITVIPSFIYDHMVKKMAGSLITKLMDHSVPDF